MSTDSTAATAAAAAGDDIIVTDYFSVPASAIVRRELRRWVIRRGPFIAAIPLALVVAAIMTRDLRWALIALMAVMVAGPMALLPVYFSIALHPRVARAVLPHRLVIRPGVSVTVEYLRDPSDPRRLPPDETHPWEQVTLLRKQGAWWDLRLATAHTD